MRTSVLHATPFLVGGALAAKSSVAVKDSTAEIAPVIGRVAGGIRSIRLAAFPTSMWVAKAPPTKCSAPAHHCQQVYP